MTDDADATARTWLSGPLYSTPMGYADPLNRDPAVERHALYGGLQVQQPGPALRGISGA